ncbi:MAG: GPP34 family phosphoprotein [Actinobacteria bacterium]|nr:GPP34 family phosphoprotein [Actinomycetota bacterium]
MLTLPEELILLAIDEEGTVGRSSSTKETITYALTAAIIMELVMAGRLKVERPVKKFLVLHIPHGKLTVIDPSPTGDEILDDALVRIRTHSKVKGPYYWIDKLGPVTVAKDSPTIDWSGKGSRFLARLASQGIVYKKEHKTLGIISSPRYRIMDQEARRQVEERLRQALTLAVPPDRRTAALVALASDCRLLSEIIPEKAQLRQAREAAGRIQKSDDEIDFLAGEVMKVRAAKDTTVYM